MLAVEGRDIYIHKKSNYKSDRGPQGPRGRYATCREINLLMISEGPGACAPPGGTGPSRDGIRHCTAIKSLSRLLSSKNSKHHGKQYFCNNCLQGFKLESSRNEHYSYCNNNETVGVKMPKKDPQ